MSQQHALEPWDRRARESEPAWQAFVTYRDMPAPRSIRRAAEMLGKSATIVGQWSSRHDWQDRVAAWDLDLDRQRREAMARENIEAGRRHAQIAAGGLQAAAAVNLEWLRRIGETPDLLRQMPLDDLRDLLVKVNRTVPRLVVAERLARGMTTESVEIAGNVDAAMKRVEGWSDAELDAFLAGATSAGLAGDEVIEGTGQPADEMRELDAGE